MSEVATAFSGSVFCQVLDKEILMNSMKNNVQPMPVLLMGLVLSVLFVPHAAWAADPQLEKAILQGKDSFAHSTFGGNGKVCESCHLAGGKEPGKLPNGKSIPSIISSLFRKGSRRLKAPGLSDNGARVGRRLMKQCFRS